MRLIAVRINVEKCTSYFFTFILSVMVHKINVFTLHLRNRESTSMSEEGSNILRSGNLYYALL